MADWKVFFRANMGAGFMARLMAVGTDKRLPLLLVLLLIVLLAQSLAQLTWQVLPGRSSSEPLLAPDVAARPGAQAGQPQASSISRIGQWHLFGEIQKVVSSPVVQATEAPDTRLNLKLSGLLASSDSVAARAIIADGKGLEEAYAVDQTLPGNAVLREIYADRVILEHRGRLETLRLPKDDVINNMASRTPARRARQAGSGRVTKQAGTAENAALLRQYRDALANEPQMLMNLVNASPVMDKTTGKIKGYRIRPGKDRKLLGRFGLKSGDVVTGVNGVTLDNPIKGLEIMRDLSTADSVTLDVERNGMMESFVFQVE